MSRIVITNGKFPYINSFKGIVLENFFNGDDTINAIFDPKGKTKAEPEQWEIAILDLNEEYQESAIYDNQQDYEHDIKLLSILNLQIELSKKYDYNDLEIFAKENKFQFKTWGAKFIGEQFIVIDNLLKSKASFVYVAHNDNGGLYQCIHNDFDETKGKKYYLFGEQAAKSYYDTGGITEILDDDIEATLYVYDPLAEYAIDDLLGAFEGYNGYAEIGQGEYEELLVEQEKANVENWTTDELAEHLVEQEVYDDKDDALSHDRCDLIKEVRETFN